MTLAGARRKLDRIAAYLLCAHSHHYAVMQGKMNWETTADWDAYVIVLAAERAVWREEGRLLPQEEPLLVREGRRRVVEPGMYAPRREE